MPQRRHALERQQHHSLVAHALIAALLLGATAAFVMLSHTVTVTVDGQPRELRTFGRTVGDVLDRNGITVGQRDSVTPDRSAKLAAGQVIDIRTARAVLLAVDGGTPEVVWTTAPDVSTVLATRGLHANAVYVSVSRSMPIPRDGLAINVRTPHSITVFYDGKRRDIQTTAQNVGGVLTELGIRLQGSDVVTPNRAAGLMNGGVITVGRIVGHTELRREVLAFRTITTKDPNLFKGQKVVKQKGKNGLAYSRYLLQTVNGKFSGPRLLSRDVRAEPINQLVTVGTKAVPKTEGAIANLNWPALAKCESGGRPNAKSRNGLFFGLYQFMIPTWEAVGGTGLPSDASPEEQTYRAQRLFKISNWRTQWPVCGKHLFD